MLAVGVIAGLGLAIAPAVRTPRPSAAEGVAAIVDGEPISLAEWSRAVDAVAADRRSEVVESEVLSRLIEEELLVQRARELGVDRTDRTVRRRLVDVVVESVVGDVEWTRPDDAAARRFYEEHVAFFTRAPRLAVTALWVGENAGADGARELARRLESGERGEVLRGTSSATVPVIVPAGLLTPTKLRDYVGPRVVDAVRSLEPGGVAEPVAVDDGWWVVRLDARESGVAPAFEQIRSLVVDEMRRRAEDAALRAYIDDLVASARISRIDAP